VCGAHQGEFAGDFVFATHTEASKAAVFDLPEDRLDDRFALPVDGLGGRLPHFFPHVLSERLLIIGGQRTRFAFLGLAAAFEVWAFGADRCLALIDFLPFGVTPNHAEGLSAGTGVGVVGFVIAKVGFDQFPLARVQWAQLCGFAFSGCQVRINALLLQGLQIGERSLSTNRSVVCH